MKDPNKAAFVRVEGTLLKRSAFVYASLYISANSYGFRERARRLGQILLTSPAIPALKFAEPSLSIRWSNLHFKGMSEDRLSVLGEECFQDILKDFLIKEGMELVQEAKKMIGRVVLVSENIEQLVSPLAQSLQVDDFLCNHMEFKQGKATGKLLPPILGGYQTLPNVQAFAHRNGIQLSQSSAYVSSAQDLLLLASVGHPCVVNPTSELRRAAKETNWPVVEY